MDLITLTLVHTALSFIALTFGIVAVTGFFKATPRLWSEWFLATALLTTITGFLFPFKGVTPAVGTGIFASLIFAVMFLARFAFQFTGFWRKVYAAGIVIQLYLLVFVAIAQAFLKLPPLNAMAPTGSEPPFAVAQLINVILFGVIGFKTVKVVRPSAEHLEIKTA